MFDVGFWEMSLIAVIALVVLGPERLPGVARTAGHWIGRARRMISDVKADIDREIRNSEIKEMEEIKKGIEETSKAVSSSISDASGISSELKEGFNIKDAIQDSAEDIQKRNDSPVTEENGKN